MEWNDVRIFLAVARDGSVRQAATTLKLNASTVSRRLAALERSLGARLFERIAGSLQPTPAAAELSAMAQQIEGAFHEVGRRISGRDSKMSGLVRVTVPRALSTPVTRAVTAFAADHSRVEVELQTSDAVADLSARDAEIAVRIGDAPAGHLVGRRVAGLAAALFASRRYLIAHTGPLSDGHHKFVEWNRQYAAKPALAWVSARYPHRKIAARGLSTHDVLELVRAGVGAGVLPCVLAGEDPTLVRLEDAPPETQSGVWVLTHREVRPSARVRALAELIASSLREQRALIEGSVLPPRGQ